MRILYIVLLAMLLATFWFVLERTRRAFDGLTPILGWLVGLAFFLLGPLTILTLNGGHEMPSLYGVRGHWGRVDLSGDTFLFPYLFVWTTLMVSCIVVGIFVWPREQVRKAPRVNVRVLERSLLITMGLSLADWVVLVWLSGGITEFLLSHWYVRNVEFVERLGDRFVLYSWLSLANQIVFTSVAALYTSLGLARRQIRTRFIVLIATFLVFGMVVSGNRIFCALYLLAFLTSCWIYRRRRILAVLIALAPVGILVFSVWASVRHDLTALSDSVTSRLEADLGNHAVTSLMDVTEGMNVMLLLHIVNDFGNRFDYLYGSSYSRVVTFVVPRSVFPSKPENFTAVLASLYEPGETTSFNATAVGEMYANFGGFSMFLLPVFSLGVLRLTYWVERKKVKHALLPTLLFILLLWVARATLADNFIALCFALLLVGMSHMERGLSETKHPFESERHLRGPDKKFLQRGLQSRETLP